MRCPAGITFNLPGGVFFYQFYRCGCLLECGYITDITAFTSIYKTIKLQNLFTKQASYAKIKFAAVQKPNKKQQYLL